ncbi:hypothetical protein [Spiroplasma citri]|nr:hypothetical protein [Spiroplasma citri]
MNIIFFLQKGKNKMKTLQDLIKDLTDITVEEQKINDYLQY